jgi:hypothetical protein
LFGVDELEAMSDTAMLEEEVMLERLVAVMFEYSEDAVEVPGDQNFVGVLFSEL